MNKITVGNFIALAHPTGILSITEKKDDVFEAIFKDISTRALFDVIVHTLSKKERFSGHLKKPWTIMAHSWALGQFLLQEKHKSKEIVSQAEIHDIGEAFINDLPSPFKTTRDKHLEKAILRALPFGAFKASLDESVKYYDLIACFAEGCLFGWGWGWCQKELESNDDVREYYEFLKRYKDWDMEDDFARVWGESAKKILLPEY